MSVHDALGFAGGAAGIEHHGHILGLAFIDGIPSPGLRCLAKISCAVHRTQREEMAQMLCRRLQLACTRRKDRLKHERGDFSIVHAIQVVARRPERRQCGEPQPSNHRGSCRDQNIGAVQGEERDTFLTLQPCRVKRVDHAGDAGRQLRIGQSQIRTHHGRGRSVALA